MFSSQGSRGVQCHGLTKFPETNDFMLVIDYMENGDLAEGVNNYFNTKLQKISSGEYIISENNPKPNNLSFEESDEFLLLIHVENDNYQTSEKHEYHSNFEFVPKHNIPDDDLIHLDLNKTSQNSFIFKTHGISSYFSGNYEESISNLNIALSLNPNDLRALHHRGLAHLRLGQYGDAIADFTEVLKINPISKTKMSDHAQKNIKSSFRDDYFGRCLWSLRGFAYLQLHSRGWIFNEAPEIEFFEPKDSPFKDVEKVFNALEAEPTNAVDLTIRAAVQFNKNNDIDINLYCFLQNYDESLADLDRIIIASDQENFKIIMSDQTEAELLADLT
ncbi:17827_t:CDS:2 [Dentiscutata erythropus]|uniref:17827_t:CDS:1 n=1 Tax=Dentiscutata erythropus TaxID=1348616 RepID=A0A9N9ARK1_9GLOM|nr:17827_t:CDS:2 [Dentiscutata erythropus]